jgi:hypothetical protein
MTMAIAVPRTTARTRSVTLVLRAALQGKFRIALIGPSPSCVTAKTLIRHGRRGVNRVQLGPSEVRGLKAGRYLVRVPVRDRSTPLVTAVTITRSREIVPSTGAARLEHTCARTILPVATSRDQAAIAAHAPASAHPHANSSTHRHHFNLLPRTIRNAIREATTHPAHAAATAGSSTLLALVFVSVLCLGGLFLMFPVARVIHDKRKSRLS